MILHSNSDSDTKEIGRRLGSKLKKGDVVSLYGDLGAGKTTMAKGIASAFGIQERDVTSPSFTIIVEYESEIPFNHIDLYRLSGSDASELGLHEYLGSDAVSVVEWAERAEDELPDDAIKVRLRYSGDESREIEIEGMDI